MNSLDLMKPDAGHPLIREPLQFRLVAQRNINTNKLRLSEVSVSREHFCEL